QVDPSRTSRWWLLFAVALAAVAQPLLSIVIADIPPPPAGWHGLVERMHGFLTTTFITPVLLGPLLLGIFLCLGFWANRSAKWQVRRERQVWEHEERGRIVGYVRKALGPDGLIRQALVSRADALSSDVQSHLNGRLVNELDFFHQRLSKRRREALWLGDQLGRFLQQHGLADLRSERGYKTGLGVYRFEVDQATDLAHMLQQRSPTHNLFGSQHQSLARIMDEWGGEYSPGFLYPLRFLDDEQELYSHPFDSERSRLRSDQGPAQEEQLRRVEDFLGTVSTVRTGFTWGMEEPSSKVFALFHQMWTRQPRIRALLEQARQVDCADPDRMWVLRVQFNVEA
ncbi:MAG: hypothetical protein HN348_36625, partial [Proteobacteria bacterium]|nr:hypothetical protein [Pseudomonadota bacterium]